MISSKNAPSPLSTPTWIDPRLEELFHCDADSGETMKKAVLASLTFCLILMWIPMPRFGSRTIISPPKEKPRPVHHQFRIKPEKVQSRQEIIQKKARTRPVPDLKPLEREPRIRAPKLEQPQIVATGDFDFEVPEAPPGTDAPLTIATPGLEMPVVTKRVSPNYPVRGLRIGVEGYVIVEAVLGRDGVVRDTRIIRKLARGKLGFEEEALAAVGQWQFLPGVLQGKPVDVRMNLRIDFRISR